MSSQQIKYPVAETFASIQGEGLWTGTPMFFIRLAGCNVGKFEKPSEMDDLNLGNLRIFNSNHSICTSAGGEKFLCDTDYYRRFDSTPEELLALCMQYKHACLTGGEPFIHNLDPLLAVFDRKIMVHVETSGTKPIPNYDQFAWITCSPKDGFDYSLLTNDLVDEWKILVGPKFNEQWAREFAAADTHKRPFYIQPIGDINSHLKENVQHCLELLKRNPEWRLSGQMHKWLEVR